MHEDFKMKKPAFTLAELLVALLIIAVILTLLAPVLTKRGKQALTIGKKNYQYKLYTYDKTNPECEEIAGVDNSLKCNFTVPAQVSLINAIAVSGGGGGAGATQSSVEYSKLLTVASLNQTTDKKQEIPIGPDITNITVKHLSGSGAGGGGASWSNTSSSGGAPQSQADCDPFNALFIPAAYNGGSIWGGIIGGSSGGGKSICATKYNAGDPKGPSIPANMGITLAQSGGVIAPNSTSICWQGITSSNCTETGIYNGCTRTVCTWDAANTICNSWAPSGTSAGDWRLPTETELNAWKANDYNIPVQGHGNNDNSLMLCNLSSFASVIRCSKGEKLCKSHCYPYYVWSSTPVDDLSYYTISLSGGSTVVGQIPGTMPSSVRCVMEKATGKVAALSGGGGGAGAYIKNYQIPSNIITSNVGGKIVLYAAAGGSGGNSASSQGSSASNGSNGNTSYIEIYDKDNVLKWGLRAPGGNYGYGATTTSFGNGGGERAINTCQLYENGAWKNINCTGAGLEGNNGAKNESASSTSTANGGNGAGSLYNSTNATGGGSGGNVSSANGYNGTLYGAGGGGATVTFDSSNNSTAGKGGSGANGVAEITYDKIYQAAAGGGGGGGAMVKLENIEVSSGNTYTLNVGAGGKAGAVNSNGFDGGESSVTFEAITYSLSGGKGGKYGTASSSTEVIIQGVGGDGGIVSTNSSDTTDVTYNNGSKGSDAESVVDNSVVYGSMGGTGGTSGIGSKGGCGGYTVLDGFVCKNLQTNGSSVSFAQPSQSATDYGSAGAGGGGGGWDMSQPNTSGLGAVGQNGYVFIYWLEN